MSTYDKQGKLIYEPPKIRKTECAVLDKLRAEIERARVERQGFADKVAWLDARLSGLTLALKLLEDAVEVSPN